MSADAYIDAVRFRYAVDHFECGVTAECDHIYNNLGNQLPKLDEVEAHIREVHKDAYDRAVTHGHIFNGGSFKGSWTHQ